MSTVHTAHAKARAAIQEVPTTVIGAVVAVLVIGGALAFGAMWGTGHGEDSTPIVTFLTGILAPTLVALLALLRVERSSKVAKDTNDRVQALQDATTPPEEPTEDDPSATVPL